MTPQTPEATVAQPLPALLQVTPSDAPSPETPRTASSLPELLGGLEAFTGWPTEARDDHTAIVTVVRPTANYRARLRWTPGRPIAVEMAVCKVPDELAGEALVTINQINSVLPTPGLVYVNRQVRWRAAVQSESVSIPHLATLLLGGVHGAAGVLRELQDPR